jgi:hypothetical protein
MRRTIALAMVCIAATAAAIGFAGCGEDEIATPTSQIDIARDTSAKAGILAIQTGIQAYIATSSVAPPAATPDVIGGFVEPWPKNPWTKAPMAEGTDPGDYTYTPGAGTTYTLVGHLSGGKEYAKP